MIKVLIGICIITQIYAEESWIDIKLIEKRIENLEADRKIENEKWEMLLKNKEKEIAYINSNGGLNKSFTYNNKELDKYKGQKVNGILIGKTLFFQSPKVISIDNLLHHYIRYRNILKSDKKLTGDWDQEVYYVVKIDMENYFTDKAAEMVNEYLSDSKIIDGKINF